jgi:hypothetical protein
MFHKNIVVPAFAALALVVCLAGPTPAFANCAEEDMAGMLFTNSCSGTVVTITEGTSSVCSRAVYDENGGGHVHFTIAYHAEGVDEDGNTYVANYHGPLTSNSGDENGNITFAVQIIFVGKGNAPKFRCTAVGKLTGNANGVTSVEFLKESEGCDCLSQN